jgi:hypothetical protein
LAQKLKAKPNLKPETLGQEVNKTIASVGKQSKDVPAMTGMVHDRLQAMGAIKETEADEGDELVSFNGKTMPSMAARKEAWLSKDEYRDMMFEIYVNGSYEDRNGNIFTPAPMKDITPVKEEAVDEELLLSRKEANELRKLRAMPLGSRSREEATKLAMLARKEKPFDAMPKTPKKK